MTSHPAARGDPARREPAESVEGARPGHDRGPEAGAPVSPAPSSSNGPAPVHREEPAANGSKGRVRRILAYRWLLILAGAVLALDQATKAWIAARLPFLTYGPPDQIEVIPGFFNLVHVGNTGAAWSLFSGRSTLLALLAVATLLAIFAWRRQLGLSRPSVQICFGLLCGGILGNLADRLIHKHVIDFLDFHFGSYVYPTFNLADSAICTGVVLYLILSLRQPEK